MFVFHGIGVPSSVELHHIGFAEQPQTVVPQGQRVFNPDPFGGFYAGLVHPLVYCLPAQGVDVVVKRLLQVDQRALARAIGPVLQCRQGDGVVGFFGHVSVSKPRYLLWCQTLQGLKFQAAVWVNCERTMHPSG